MFLNKYNDDSKISNYINILVLGNKNNFDNEEMNKYTFNGVTHLFAISGMHISILSLILLNLLKKLKIEDDKSNIIVIILLWIYAFITSFSGSVLRSTMFFTLLSLNKIYYTNIKTINIMLLSVVILILINPFIIYDLGYQYSVATSFGLIYYSKYLNEGNYIIKLIKTSLIALLFSIPISINTSYEINIFSIVNNLIFVPYVTLILYPLCLISYILEFLSPILNIFINIIEWLNTCLSNIKLFIINIPKMNWYYVIIYYLIVLISINKKKRLIINLLIIILIIIIPKLDKKAYVYFLDIGQGDSSLLISPYRKDIVMIDTGGKLNYEKDNWQINNKKYNVSDNVIIFLKSIGITKINLLLLSHGDEDHAGDAVNIMKKIKVNKIMLNKGSYNNLEKMILNVNSKQVTSYNNYFKISNLNRIDHGNENDNSIISLIRVFNYNFLYMGDASKKQEIDLINTYKFKVNVLKVGHHGSKTSSHQDFLATIKPNIAIISSGRNNRFNHPSKDTIDNLNKLKIKYLNTQESGTIVFNIYKNKMKIKTINP